MVIVFLFIKKRLSTKHVITRAITHVCIVAPIKISFFFDYFFCRLISRLFTLNYFHVNKYVPSKWIHICCACFMFLNKIEEYTKWIKKN